MAHGICKKTAARLKDFITHWGFALITTICICVITSTALWTNQHQVPYTAPTPPVLREIPAAQLMQESLATAVSPAPQNTPAPLQWKSPVDELIVLQDFNDQILKRSPDMGIWKVHDGVDLKTEPGDKIYAMEQGIVSGINDSDPDCCVMSIDHAGGYTVIYSGLYALSAVQVGDEVYSRLPVGFAGGTITGESTMGCHLHLSVYRDGIPVDPLLLLLPPTE